MKRIHLIISSITLIIASVLIHVLVEDSKTNLDIELINFFSGFAFGIGVAFLVFSLYSKKLKIK